MVPSAGAVTKKRCEKYCLPMAGQKNEEFPQKFALDAMNEILFIIEKEKREGKERIQREKVMKYSKNIPARLSALLL